jgi:hypothetical protein
MTLPKVPIKGDPETRRFLSEVKDAVDTLTDGTGRAVTLSDVANTNFRGRYIDPVLDQSIPPVVSNLTAEGRYNYIILEWNYPDYPNHRWTRIYRSSTNNFETAEVVANVAGRTYADPVGNNQTFYYWAANVSTSNIEGPLNATAGTVATSGNITFDDLNVVDPVAVTGLALSSSAAVAASGETIIKLLATWNASSFSSFAYYDIEIKEASGSYIGYQTATASFEWPVKAGTLYTVRVRSVNSVGEKSAFSSPVTHTTGGDSTIPAAPTSLAAVASLRNIFLTWSNAGDSDLAGVEVWESSTSSQAAATRVAVVNATPGGGGGFTRSGLSPSEQRYYWLKSIDTSGNVSNFNSPTGVSATTLQASASDIAAGAITADKILAGEITGDKFNTLTSLPGTITVGLTGVSIGTIESRAADPAARVNANSTLIDPGRILISGGTTLSSWRNGSDQTKIEGGSIAANTVTANKLEIGARGLSFEGVEFSYVKTTNVLSWTAGVIGYTADDGSTTSVSISSGNVTWTSGVVYVYWVKGQTVLSTTTTRATAYGADRVLMAIYSGGYGLTLNYGRTLIDGDEIRTGTIQANRLQANSLSALFADLGTVTAGVARNATDTFNIDLTAGRINFDTGPGSRVTGTNARIVFDNGAYMKVSGVGFGSTGQFIEWFGPKQASTSLCTEANAVYYLKANGQAYFGGALLAGVLRNSAQGTILNSTNTVELGPFSSNGNQITITGSFLFFGETTYPGTSTGLASYNATSKFNPTFTIVLSREINGGGYTDVGTYNVNGTHDAVAPIPADVSPGYYHQFANWSTTYVDPSNVAQNRRYKLRFTAYNINTTPQNNTLALQSIEQ